MSTPLALLGISFSFLVFLLFLISPKEDIKLKFPYLWMWVFIQTIFFNWQGAEAPMDVSLLFIIHISVFFLLYYSVALGKINWKYIVYPLGYICLFVSVFSILEKFNIRQFKYDILRDVGTLGNPTNTAMYIAATSPFLLQYKRGWVYFLIPLIAICMLMSASAFIGIYSIIVVYFILKKYYARLIGLFTISLGVVCWQFDKVKIFFTPAEKLHIWSLAITDWKKFAWLGKGIGHFRYNYTTHNGIVGYEFMHNHYLWVLYTLGIFGLCFLFYFLIPILKNHQKVLPFVSVISVLIMSTCSVPMRVYPIVLLTAINLGILTKGDRGGDKILVSNRNRT